jgi:hypothetical protein
MSAGPGREVYVLASILNHLNNQPNRSEDLVCQLAALPREERCQVLAAFCRHCGEPIAQLNWLGINCCITCSPDSGE